jgi:hypothetical protein
MSNYYIYRGNKKLSGFYPNGLQTVFTFRKNDWMTFYTKQKAEKTVRFMKKQVDNESERYGMYAKKHQSIARNLKVGELKRWAN